MEEDRRNSEIQKRDMKDGLEKQIRAYMEIREKQQGEIRELGK
jgi:hypothetical protein